MTVADGKSGSRNGPTSSLTPEPVKVGLPSGNESVGGNVMRLERRYDHHNNMHEGGFTEMLEMLETDVREYLHTRCTRHDTVRLEG
jgi:hypothetical protein